MASLQLRSELLDRLRSFAAENDLADLYAAYEWGVDKHSAGFPRILELEARLTASSRTTGVTIEEVKAVADWGGGARNLSRIRGPAICLPVDELYGTDGRPLRALTDEPERPMRALSRVQGIGPTYASKVLRFAMPWDYGAIDSRCVRTFGGGQEGEARCWIGLTAVRSGDRWGVPESQADWPRAYGAWIRVLRHLADTLPPNCPHPPAFVRCGLRQRGAWTCADVEMALFAYASRVLDAAKGSCKHGAERVGRSCAPGPPPNEKAARPSAAFGGAWSTTKGGGRAKRFRWHFSTEGDTVEIVNENGRQHRFPLDEVRQVLSDLHEQFGSGFFPLANNVATMGDSTEQAGLGMAILRQRPGDVTHAQGASYLGVVLEEIGYLSWNGKARGIEWRIVDEDFRREAMLRRIPPLHR